MVHHGIHFILPGHKHLHYPGYFHNFGLHTNLTFLLDKTKPARGFPVAGELAFIGWQPDSGHIWDMAAKSTIRQQTRSGTICFLG